MATPKVYRRLLKALSTGKTEWAARLLTDGDGRQSPVWPLMAEVACPSENSGTDTAEMRLAKRLRYHGDRLWAAVWREAPVEQRIALSRLLQAHQVPYSPDQALAGLWGSSAFPEGQAYWHTQGVSLAQGRATLVDVHLNVWATRREVEFRSPDLSSESLLSALVGWKDEDPVLFDTPEKRGRILRWLAAKCHVAAAEVLAAWDHPTVIFESWDQESYLPLLPDNPGSTLALPMPAGNILTDLARNFASDLDRRMGYWTNGPAPSYPKVLARWEAQRAFLIKAGADPHAEDKAGRSAQSYWHEGPSQAYLTAWVRKRALAERPAPPAPRRRRV